MRLEHFVPNNPAETAFRSKQGKPFVSNNKRIRGVLHRQEEDVEEEQLALSSEGEGPLCPRSCLSLGWVDGESEGNLDC